MSVRLPSLTGLRAFEAAARHLSFTRAAEELNVTQTAISHQIRRLEDQLGLKLFVRRHRALTLTPAGAAYLPAVSGAFDDLRRATARVTAARDEGVLTVSTLTTLAAKWLVPRLMEFQTRHPDIEVRLTTSPQLVDLRRDDVDVAIRYGHGNWPGLKADFLMNDELFPVCAPTYAAAAGALDSPADLAGHTLLHVSPNPESWRQWLTAAGYPDLEGRRNITFDLQLTALEAAMDGMGVAIGRSRTVERDLQAGRLVRPFALTSPAAAGFYVVVPEEEAATPKIVRFRDWVTEVARRSPTLEP
ncbi:MAG: transcriptional regulator GcvA [Sneathiellaceae bacterium]